MNSDLYGRFIADLKLKSYAKKSEQSYVRAVRQLQNFCCKALEDITEEEVREYWLYCKEKLNWGSATLRISYSGIKLFYGYTLKREWEVLRAVKFERDQTLPVVLNIDEVRAILRNLPNLANRAFFTLVYRVKNSPKAGKNHPSSFGRASCYLVLDSPQQPSVIAWPSLTKPFPFSAVTFLAAS